MLNPSNWVLVSKTVGGGYQEDKTPYVYKHLRKK